MARGVTAPPGIATVRVAYLDCGGPHFGSRRGGTRPVEDALTLGVGELAGWCGGDLGQEAVSDSEGAKSSPSARKNA